MNEKTLESKTQRRRLDVRRRRSRIVPAALVALAFWSQGFVIRPARAEEPVVSQDRQQLEEARRDYQRAVTEHGADSAEAEKAKDALRATRRRLYERVRQDQRGADKSQSPDADDRRR